MMEWVRKIRVSTIVMAALVLVAGAWGINRWQEQRRYVQFLENMYQKSFYELVDGLGNMEINLSKLLVSETPDESVKYLSSVWRMADSAQSSLSQLPLQDDRMNDAVKFINQLGDYCHQKINTVAAGRPLSDDDRDSVNGLLERCAQVTSIMRDVQSRNDMGDIDLWAVSEPGDGAGFGDQLADSGMMGLDYPALIYDGPFSDASVGIKGTLLRGQAVTESEALHIARLFVGKERVRDVDIAEDIAGEIPCHGVDVTLLDDTVLSLAITRSGGHVLWMMSQSAPPEGEPLDEDALMDKAAAFLKGAGYSDMAPSYMQTANGVTTISFTPMQSGAILYADLVKLEMDAATGDVVGIESGNYLRNHRSRYIGEPLVSQEEAAGYSPRLEVDRVQRCVIPTPSGERFCWELTGRMGGAQYVVYIDAMSGAEVDILRIIDAEGGQLAL